jgi:acetyl esterase
VQLKLSSYYGEPSIIFHGNLKIHLKWFSMNKIIIAIFRLLFDLVGPLLGPKNYKIETKEILLKENLKIKIYTPLINTKNDVALYFHGGGWIIGSVKAYDRILKFISSKTGFTVVGIDYRKAPEFKYPSSIEDAATSYLWVMDNIIKNDSSAKIALIGDSAGGSIVTELIKIIKLKSYVMADLAVLIYPAIGLSANSLSILKKSKPRWLNLFGYIGLKYCLNQYYNNTDELSDTSSDLNILSNTNSREPKISILLAEYDPLSKFIFKWRKEQLKANEDRTIEYLTYPNTIHGFINFSRISKQARKALNKIVDSLINID